jgi:hypothetical protein
MQRSSHRQTQSAGPATLRKNQPEPNPKGPEEKGQDSDCPGRAFSRSGGKSPPSGAGPHAGGQGGPERSHVGRGGISTAFAHLGSTPRNRRIPLADHESRAGCRKRRCHPGPPSPCGDFAIPQGSHQGLCVIPATQRRSLDHSPGASARGNPDRSGCVQRQVTPLWPAVSCRAGNPVPSGTCLARIRQCLRLRWSAWLPR